MPHATASWLVDNTALTFEQIAEFCGLHVLEVNAMADDLTSAKYTGRDPLRSGELTNAEIEKGQNDPAYRLKMFKVPVTVSRTKGARYTPVSKRQDKPDGIAWILRNHPEVSDAQVGKLIGTTRNTIGAIRDRSHWNISNINPKDPVTLGLCSQRELDAVVAKAAKNRGPEDDAADVARLGSDREALIEELRPNQNRRRSRPRSRSRRMARRQTRRRSRRTRLSVSALGSIKSRCPSRGAGFFGFRFKGLRRAKGSPFANPSMAALRRICGCAPSFMIVKPLRGGGQPEPMKSVNATQYPPNHQRPDNPNNNANQPDGDAR